MKEVRLKKFYAVSDFVKSTSYNASTGRISFKITVPRNSEVRYEVYPTSMIAQREYGSMLEKITGTVKNSNKNKSCDKTVTVTPGYYGTYKIYAYYGWGRATYIDTKYIMRSKSGFT